LKNSVSFFRLMCIYSIDIKKERKNEEENVNDYQCTCIWDNRNVCKWNGIVSTGDKQCRKGLFLSINRRRYYWTDGAKL